MLGTRLNVKMGTTLAADERWAVEEIREQIRQPEPFTTLFFCSPSYDLPRLAACIGSAFPRASFGCTSAGQIGPMGFQRGGLSAVSLAGDALRVTPHAIRGLHGTNAQAEAIGRRVREAIHGADADERAFGFLLIDGLSLMEEQVASSLHHALGEIPLVGGSAGDDLTFEATYVFVDGEFSRDAALLLLVETRIPFRTLKVQHFAPTGDRMVITAAEPERRVVTEINGEPAALEYARLIGRSPAELTAEVFSQHPVMLKIGQDYYVRAIQRVSPDGSLTFFCAIERGLVLHLGRGIDVIGTMEAAFAEGGQAPNLVLGCDCILRRIELEQRGLDGRVGEIFRQNRVFGFSTYGEQYGGVHVSQTFTGVALRG